MIGREAARLERLVGDLLALARLRQGVLEVEREPVDLGAVAREAEERLRPRARAAGVEVRVEGGAAPATADHGRTLQVVSNLSRTRSGSARRAAPSTLAVGPGELRGRRPGAGYPAGGDPPRLRALPPARAAPARGSPDGAGLGLAIVRELSEAMGGSVAVENLPARGARFTVRLPG